MKLFKSKRGITTFVLGSILGATAVGLVNFFLFHYEQQYKEPKLTINYAWRESVYLVSRRNDSSFLQKGQMATYFQVKKGEKYDLSSQQSDFFSGELLPNPLVTIPLSIPPSPVVDIKNNINMMTLLSIPKDYVCKILLINTGTSIITNIRIEIGFPFIQGNPRIFATPNIELKEIKDNTDYSFPCKTLIVRRLPLKTKAVITIQWFFNEESIPSSISSEFSVETYQGMKYLPKILFVSSDQTTSKVGNKISFLQVLDEEEKIIGIPPYYYNSEIVPLIVTYIPDI